MKSLHQERVERFLTGAGHEVPSKPTLPSPEKRKLQATLLLEECIEAIHALGFTPTLWDDTLLDEFELEANHVDLVPNRKENLEDIAHELGDCDSVVIGTLSMCGIHDQPLQQALDSHNLGKLAHGTHRADGKLVRPDGYPKPPVWLAMCQQDANYSIIYEVHFEDHLRNLIGDRILSLNKDDYWLSARTSDKLGLTPAEAAIVYFRQLLVKDLETTT